ncbi:cupin domain-containing protein [Chloroflexia bacterium SDU3-3]|nr:cupin domain-containing protein [Chloroflexia bacterium SDU3-3]
MTTDRWIEMAPGVLRRTLAAGEHLMQMEVTLQKGSTLPLHHHPHEQVTHVIRGRLRMHLAGTPHEIGAGDSLLMLPNMPHDVEALEDSLVIDTFSPPREDLLAQDRGQQG